jgi:hypothetical protein
VSDWASGEGFTTLEQVFTSRDFGRPAQAVTAVPAAKPAPRAGRAYLFTNRALAVISASAAALSVVATLVVNGGGPALSPVISAQHAPSNVPDFLTPVPQGSAGQGGSGGSAAAGATASPGGAPTAPGTTATAGGTSAGAGASGGGSAGTTVVALGPSPASASLASFTVSHPTHTPPPPPPTTTTSQPPPISAGGAATGGGDNGKGNGGQNNGNGNAKGVSNNGGGTVLVSNASSPGHGKGKGKG